MAEYFRCSEENMHIQGNPSVSRAAVSVRGPSSPSAAGAQIIPSKKRGAKQHVGKPHCFTGPRPGVLPLATWMGSK